MPVFVYKAKQGPQRTVHGEFTAESRAAAVAGLDAMGYSPVWVREKRADERGHGRRVRIGRIGSRDLTVFTQQLASLTRSGVPILKALATIAEQTENARLQVVVEDLAAQIREGSMLSEAMARYPGLFSELYLNMVRSGEGAGVLDAILTRLSNAREQEEETRRKVQAALAYPVLVLTVGAATVFVLLAFFLPRVAALFENYGDLPTPTRILLGISHALQRQWHWVLFAGLLVFALYKRLTALEKGRALADRFKLLLPLAGRFIQHADVARFARTLALLLETGVPIDRALSLSANTLQNAALRADIEAARRSTVEQGLRLSAGLRRTRYVPLMFANMAAVGEEAGRLDEALNEVASFYEHDCDQRSRIATSLLEPILILAVGLVVGFIVTAMLLPIFEIGTGL